jgi:pyrroloquinoline-quinone synthase
MQHNCAIGDTALDMLWARLDALYSAYVDGHVPPGAFVPMEA